MRTFILRFTATALLGLAALSTAHAQTAPVPPTPGTTPPGNGFRVGNVTSNQPTGATYGTAYSTPFQAGFAVQPSFYPGYAPGWYAEAYDPFRGFQQGAADLLNSFGNYAINVQQSRLVGQQVEQARIDTRRKQWEEWLYERAVKPKEEDEREAYRMQQLRRSLGNPPEGEVWSGKALNDILDNIRKMQSPGVPAPYVPVSEDVIKRLNIQGSGAEGNFGLLKEGGQLTWPFALRSPAFDTERKKLNKLFADAYNQANAGEVEFETVNNIRTTLGNLDENLRGQVKTLSSNHYIQSRRYINELTQAAKALEDPNISKYAQKKWVAQGNSVSDVLKPMFEQGLRFGPSVQGDQAAYFAMHKAMVDYNLALYRMVGGSAAPAPMGPMGPGPR